VNKLSLLILILLITNNCSVDKKKRFWDKDKSNIEEVKNVKIILTKQIENEQEFNPTLEIKITRGTFNKDFENNQNDTGELSYTGVLEEVGKYKFSKFDDFEYVDVQPIFYNKNIIFFDNKGTIILYDQNQKIIWKKNYYNKSEKKLRPRLNFAIKKNTLIVTDDVAKYYAINIENGDIIWSKNNIVPFKSEIKIKDDFFYTVDYKNILKYIYFNNSIGDITAVNSQSGQLIWQLPTQSNNISKNAFQLSNSKLVINEDAVLFSNNKNEFYSIDITTGLINWKNEINSNLRPVIIGQFIITASDKGFLYVIDKEKGNIIRINDLHKDYNIKKRKNIFTTGFFVARNKVYLSNDDGMLIIADLDTGKIINIKKIASNKILKPYVKNDNLFLIKNGSIIRFN